MAPSSTGRPAAYFITFSCYGARLHFDERGSVDRAHNIPGTPLLPAQRSRQEAKAQLMDQPPYVMDDARRDVVLRTIVEVCRYRQWTLHAAHVRSNHVHVVVQADTEPEKVMNDLKVYASRRLNEQGLDPSNRKRWTRHGSTKYLWKPEAVAEKVHYALHEQGEAMAIYPTEPRP